MIFYKYELCVEGYRRTLLRQCHPSRRSARCLQDRRAATKHEVMKDVVKLCYGFPFKFS
jgi:hypothetical protein